MGLDALNFLSWADHEFDFRYNHRSALGVEDVARSQAALKGVVGKRLPYRVTDRSQA